MSMALTGPIGSMRRLGARQLGWPLAALAVLTALASLVLLASNHEVLVPRPGEPFLVTVASQVAGPLIAVLVVAVLGALAISREPNNWVGWCWSGLALTLAWMMLAQEYAIRGLIVAPGTLPASAIAAWLQAGLVNIVLLGVVLGLLLFPDGHLPSTRWRALLVFAVVITALSLLDSLADRRPIGTFLRQESFALPVTMPPALWGLGSAFASWSGFWVFWSQAALVPLAGVAIVLRLRRSTGDQRQQLKWVAYGGALAGFGWLVGYLADLPLPFYAFDPTLKTLAIWGNLLWLIGITIATPIAAGVAILRYRLYDIDRVIDRTLLVGSLAGFVTVVYIAVVLGIGATVGDQFGPALSLIATAIVAVAFAPARSRLQTMVNHMVYGKRASPYDVLAEFAERAGGSYRSDEVLPAMARLLGEGTGASRAQVWLRVDSELRATGSWPDDSARVALPIVDEQLPVIAGCHMAVPVLDGGELLGALTVTKSRSERLTPGEEKLMADLARQVGLVLRNVRLVEELRLSRQRIVSAHDEERRRLERNLHDGAQQQLVTASLALGVARTRFRAGNPDEIERDLEDVAARLKAGLVELRTLARGLHPAVVTEAGLSAALQSLVVRSPIPATLVSSIERRYPPAVEATGYYVVAEGLTNVAKHAGASSAVIRAAQVGEVLILEIEDDGVGGADGSLGSGLRGLEDRVAALGGWLQVESRSGQGTCLRAELPCLQ